MSDQLILRIVPRGARAEYFADDAECDLEEPCDLVALKLTTVAGCHRKPEEHEMQRKEFESGHAASRYLLDLVQGKVTKGE